MDGVDGDGLPAGLARSPLPTGLLDAGGDWVTVNPALAAVLGSARPTLATLLDEPGLDVATLLQAVDAGVTVRLVLPSGEGADAVVTRRSAAPAATFLVQVTPRGEVEALEGRTREAVTALEAFVSRIAHDLRNPIGTALGFAELLVADLGPDDGARGFGERVLSSTVRAAELLEELVTEARTAARIDPPDDVDVGAVLETVRRELADLVAERGATIVAGGALPRLRSDARVLHRALSASIRNAVEHHPGAARVTVWARPAARGWELVVDDDGPGLSPADREAVLTPGHTRRADGRAGLGLPLARAGVERRGGTLRLDGNDAGGLRVLVLLPQRRANDPEVARV